MFFVLSQAWDKEKLWVSWGTEPKTFRCIGAWNPKVWGLIPHGDSEFFLCPTLVTRWKTSTSKINYFLSTNPNSQSPKYHIRKQEFLYKKETALTHLNEYQVSQWHKQEGYQRWSDSCHTTVHSHTVQFWFFHAQWNLQHRSMTAL